MEELIINRQNSELAFTEQNTALTDGNTLHITPDYDFTNSDVVDYNAFLNMLVQYLNIEDMLEKISAETQYSLTIPFTGKNTPFMDSDPVQKLADGCHNMVMQQQMARLTDMVEDVYRVAEDILQGQTDDRLGLLKAGKDGILLAMSMPEGLEKTIQLDSGRQNILAAQGQIGKILERKVRNFEELPKSSAGRFFREMIHGGYHSEKDREVEEIQEYYNLYLHATKLLSASYSICGNIDTAGEVYRLGENFLKEIDFSKLKSIENIHGELTDMFYDSPVEIMKNQKEQALLEAKQIDCLKVDVTGEKLMEVINGEERV